MFGLALGITLGGAAACGPSAASSEADVVVSPVELARALADDREAALERFGGKVLAAARSEFEALSIGDTVTLRCHLDVLNETATLFLVKACRIAD